MLAPGGPGLRNSDGVDPHDACQPGSGADTITLPAGTYLRTASATLDVSSPVTLNPDRVVVIDGDGSFPLFVVAVPGTLTMADMTVRRGSAWWGRNLQRGGHRHAGSGYGRIQPIHR